MFPPLRTTTVALQHNCNFTIVDVSGFSARNIGQGTLMTTIGA